MSDSLLADVGRAFLDYSHNTRPDKEAGLRALLDAAEIRAFNAGTWKQFETPRVASTPITPFQSRAALVTAIGLECYKDIIEDGYIDIGSHDFFDNDPDGLVGAIAALRTFDAAACSQTEGEKE